MKIWGHLYYVVILLLLTPLFYVTWFMPGLPGMDDLSNFYIPQRFFLHYAYQSGQMPFWNPFNFAGQPILAAGQSSPLYLPNIVFAIFSVQVAMKISYLFHFYLISIGMYALTFRFTHSRNASFLASTTFLTCGFFVGHQIHTQLFDAFAWMPFLVLCTSLLLEKRSFVRLSLFSLIYALIQYAGHPQMAFTMSLFVGIYVLQHIIRNPQGRVWNLLSVAFATSVGLLLSAPQWYTTLKFLGYSSRSYDPSYLLAGSMPPAVLMQMVFPSFVFSLPGTFWEYTCAIGFLNFLLVISYLVVSREKERVAREMSISLFGFTALTIGKYLVFSTFVLLYVPGFNLFRMPTRYVGVVDFILSILAAYGFSKLEKDDKEFRKLFLFSIYCCVVASIVLSLLLHRTYFLDIVLILISGISTIILLTSVNYRKAVPYILALITICNGVWCISESSFIRSVSPVHTSGLSSFLQSHLSKPYPFYRVADLTNQLYLERGTQLQIPMINGYDSIVSKWYTDAAHGNTIRNMSRLVMDELDVEYLIAFHNDTYVAKHDPKSWELVDQLGDVQIWKNLDELQPAQIQSGAAYMEYWNFNQQRWIVQSEQGGLLTLSQIYDPGWHATIDGRTTSVMRTSELLTSVRVPKGVHKIVLSYQPVGWRTSLVLFLVGVIIWVFVALYFSTKSRGAAMSRISL